LDNHFNNGEFLLSHPFSHAQSQSESRALFLDRQGRLLVCGKGSPDSQTAEQGIIWCFHLSASLSFWEF